MAVKAKYWAHKGRFQKLVERYQTDGAEPLYPLRGHAPTYHGEVLRLATKIYYDIYNNGGCNLDADHFKGYARVVYGALESLEPFATKLKIKDFEYKLCKFTVGKNKDNRFNDEVIDVILKFCEHKQKGSSDVRKLVDNAEFVLSFLDQHPPHFSDGKSMETDLGAGLGNLRKYVDRVKPKVVVMT